LLLELCVYTIGNLGKPLPKPFYPSFES
jgi:hypothetical protein